MAEDRDSKLEQNVIALAEQLGRFIGTAQRTADGLIDRESITEQVTRIRDEASALLDHISESIESGSAAARKRPQAKSQAAAKPRGRSGGAVDAPGKKHRTRPPSARGAKHSDERIAKIAGAKTMRRGQRRG